LRENHGTNHEQWMVRWSFCPAAPSMQRERTRMDKRVMILTQVLMTLMMAILMSGIMSAIAMGFTAEWLAAWPTAALVAWPIAFILTQGTFPLANLIARKIMPPRAASKRA